MAELDREKLYVYFTAKANAGVMVTVKGVAQDFGVEDGAASKAMHILTGSGVLVEKSKGEYDCARVLQVTKAEFASAASQGKDTTYVDSLWAKIALHKKNNETMKAKLQEAQARITELESKLKA